MEKLGIKNILGTAWGQFKKRGWYLFGLTLAAVGLAVLVSGEAVTTALAYIVLGGYLALLLKHARNETVMFDDLFDLDRRWIYFAFGGVIKGTLIALGLLFFVVPGVYLAIRWMFSDLFILDQGMRPIEALRASSKLTEGYRWQLFGYALLLVLFTILGLLFFVVGVFVAMAVLNLASIFLFWRLQEAQYLNSLKEQSEGE